MPDITVHHLEQSRSHRILWLLAELDLPYTLKIHQRHPVTIRAPEALKAIHPLGKAPIVVIDGEVLAESGAIIEHLIDAHGPHLRPAAGTPEAIQYRYWLHYAEGSLMPPLLVKLIFGKLRTTPMPFFIKPIARAIAGKVDAAYTTPELTTHFDFIEQHLATHAYFAGDTFTGADLQMSYPIEAAFEGGRHGSDSPATRAWLDRVRARPGYAAAVAAGGPNTVPGGPS